MTDAQIGHKQTLLLVDDAAQNISVLRGILQAEYNIRVANSGARAIQLALADPPDLILLDINMPEMDGYLTCRELKAAPSTTHIPVIFVSALSDTLDEQKGFDVGAVDYITKPVNPALVRARVRTHLALADQQRSCLRQVIERTRELEQAQRAAIFMLGRAGHYNDTDTGAHIWRMAAYAAELARAAGWPVDKAQRLELAAPMHDTGKIGIPDAILKAPRPLSAEEWEIMKSHTVIGHQILSHSESELFQLAATIALDHHEHWDGSGYPRGLAGSDIAECARIVAIADVFDALTMQRAYKEAWQVDAALEQLKLESGSHFDPQLVDRFIAIKQRILTIHREWQGRSASGFPSVGEQTGAAAPLDPM